MKKGNNTRSYLVAITLLLSGITSACSPSSEQWRQSAPTSNDEVGTILHGASLSEVESFLEANPDAQARKVSEAHQIYEIFSADSKSLEQQFPQADIYQNEFYPLKKSSPLTIQSLSKKYEQYSDSANKKPNPFSTCVKNEEAPTPQITIDFPKLELADGVMDLGGFFSLAASASTAHMNHPSELKKTWFVIPPTESAGKAGFIEGEQLNYKPDTVGSYSLGLLVQDARGVCGLKQAIIIVTHNPGYTGPSVDLAEYRAKHNLAAFKHLTELQAGEAWALSEGQGVTIAIIDTGVNYNHPALAHNIMVNAGDTPNNGLDDDNNGYVDDTYGYDFANYDSDPYDDEGHGSHVAGLAASPVFGLARQARILSIKALSPVGGDPASIAAAVLYAVDRGAKVINMSLGGGSSPHPLMIKAMAYAEAQNVTIIAAAGNGDDTGKPVNIDESPIYPAGLPNSNIISVAAKDSVGLLAPYSNYGVSSVDVVAPGGGITPDDLIYSCTTYNPANSPYVGLQGTSMAAPIVAGMAAQVLALNPNLHPSHVRSIMMSAGTPVEGLTGIVGSGKYLNAYDVMLKSAQLLSFSSTFH